MWIALLSLAILCSLGVAWSLAGRVPLRARGHGIIVRGEIPVQVTASSAGRVTKVHRAVGDSVSAGELIAELDVPELRQQLTEAQGLLTALQQSDRKLHAEEQQSIAALVAATVRPDGTAPVTEANALERMDDLLAARASRAMEIERVSATVRRLVQAQEEMTQIRAAAAGTVVAIDAELGSTVDRGMAVARVSPGTADGRVRCIAAVHDADRGRIAPGMPARLSPERTRPEIHGFVRGTVERVMSAGDAESSETVIILIDADASSPSGVAWVGGRGVPDRMAPVSEAEVVVTVEEVAPIAMAMPWLARQ